MEGTKEKGAARLKGATSWHIMQHCAGCKGLYKHRLHRVSRLAYTAFQPLRAFFACTLAGLERLTVYAFIPIYADMTWCVIVKGQCRSGGFGGLSRGRGFLLSPLERLYYSIGVHK